MVTELDKLKAKFEKTLSAANEIEERLDVVMETVASQQKTSPHQERLNNKSKSNDGLSK